MAGPVRAWSVADQRWLIGTGVRSDRCQRGGGPAPRVAGPWPCAWDAARSWATVARYLPDTQVHHLAVTTSFAVGCPRPQIRRRPLMLVELGLVEQHYQAVLEVLSDGTTVTDAARGPGPVLLAASM